MKTAGPWDLCEVHNLVRDRHHFYVDEVDRLMKQERKLLPVGGDDLREQIIQLAQRIEIVEKNGGDATALRAERDEIVARRDEHEPALVKVQLALARARECMKWTDMAHDGMHWLCFAEPKYLNLTEDA